MESDDIETQQDHGAKKKTPIQLQSLEKFYSEEKYPKQKEIEDYAASLKLTYNQVRIWFSERRRKDKRENDALARSHKKIPIARMIQAPACNTGNNKKISFGQTGAKTKTKTKNYETNKKRSLGQGESRALTSLNYKQTQNPMLSRSKRSYNALHVVNKCLGQKNEQKALGKKELQRKPLVHFQVLFPKDYILKKVFRKDGPPLGVEFDPLPAGASGYHIGSNKSPRPFQDSKRIPKKRKVSELSVLKSQTIHDRNVPGKRYGIGKGLMTVWRATNPDSDSFPAGLTFNNKNVAGMGSHATSKAPLHRESKRSECRKLATKQTSLGRNKSQEKRKTSIRKRKVSGAKDATLKMLRIVECKLAVNERRPREQANSLVVLVDDEELELSELQAGPNPPRCAAHLASNGRSGCSLCKDMLSRFPPPSVKMKQPMCTRPWDSSLENVKKLFKVLRFLYTHAVVIDICPFSLDEFAQAFHDKDSMLLGKIHVALLKLLLLDVEREISAGFPPRASKDCRFLGFLQSVRHQEFDVSFWVQSLNSLTWTEILRQVLIAAGFGLNQNSARRGTRNKEANRMAKYGLRPHTLKVELFKILFEKGSGGSKVSDLAKASQIAALNLPNTTPELEHLICSTLSSDITLFEKIAPFAYRLRANPIIKKGLYDSDSESDCGGVDDDSEDTSSSSSGDESYNSEWDSPTLERSIIRYNGCDKRKSKRSTQLTEIDESFSGEAWVLGLMEGEYSNLSIKEKLNALVALVELTSCGSSLRMEEPSRATSAIVPDTRYHGSGAKIKKLSAGQQTLEGPLWPDHIVGATEPHLFLELLPYDSSSIGQKASNEVCSSANRSECCEPPSGPREKDPSAVEESGSVMHPLQSIHLGSDRRYNSYWLFLGPCNTSDPGHRRVYFESSEDGHWEVIDTEQALSALLSVLDGRGSREAHLLSSLEKREAFLCRAMIEYTETETEISQRKRSDPSDPCATSGGGSSPVSDIDNNLVPEESRNIDLGLSGAILLEFGKNCEEREHIWDRLQSFDKWIWNSFYCNLSAVKHSKKSYLDSLARCEICHDLYWRDEKHCRICHITFELDFDLEERYAIHVATCRETEGSGIFPTHKVLPSQLQALKAAIHAIEAAMPEEALVGAWTRSAHKLWVKRLRRTSSMPELLQVVADFVGAINEDWLHECALALGYNTGLDDILVLFQTMPQTTSAVALWMVKLDMMIAPHLQKLQSEKAPGRMTQLKRRRPGT